MGAYQYFIPMLPSVADEMQRRERSEHHNISTVPTATLSHFASTRIVMGQISSHEKSASALRGCREGLRGKTGTLRA